MIRLKQYVGDDLSVVNAARVSYNKQSDVFTEKDRRLIKFLLANKHMSPFEHNSMTFHVKCPIFVARQWFRHRIGVSYNEISGRYTRIDPSFYYPGEGFRKDPKSTHHGDEGAKLDKDFWIEKLEEHYKASYRLYESMLVAGVAKEHARMVLPQAVNTEFYFTCNLRSLLHFLGLRLTPAAQEEIRKYAEELLVLAEKIFPETIAIWKDLCYNKSDGSL